MIVMRRRLLPALATCVALAGVTACGTGAGTGAGTNSSGGSDVDVVAAFYPLQYAVEQIGGDHVNVTGLTKPGVEPHDLELTAQDVARVAKADTVVYLGGFQSAVDDAVDTQAKDRGFDVSTSARLDLAASPDEHAGESTEHPGESTTEHPGESTTEHPGESPTEHDEHAGESTTDPHFWLDPKRYADVADAIAQRLSSLDAAHAADYQARAKDFTARLAALDREFAAGLKTCTIHDLVTSHAAFGYLAQAYGLHQESITGLTPDADPSPAALARIATFVKDEGVRTIYAETLVSPKVAQTLARETGAKLAVLDPVEGLTDDSAGKDYFEVMRSNLTTLRAGQDCA
jgi:zinc transport system substrate-binding protein